MIDTEWEYGFYDSEYPEAVYWSTFGGIVGFKTAEMAEHTASKSVWGQAMIVRRKVGRLNFEPDAGVGTECLDGVSTSESKAEAKS